MAKLLRFTGLVALSTGLDVMQWPIFRLFLSITSNGLSRLNAAKAVRTSMSFLIGLTLFGSELCASTTNENSPIFRRQMKISPSHVSRPRPSFKTAERAMYSLSDNMALMANSIPESVAWNSVNREEQYQSLQENYFQPFYNSRSSQSLIMRDGYELIHRIYENPKAKGSIVIIQGRTESTFKYAEQIFDFFHMGYSVFVFDFRGQGFSKHLIEDHPTYGHIDDFHTYVDDLYDYLNKVVLGRKKGKLLAYCHSMGAAVGALFELEYPGVFDGYVWQSPMFDINTGPFHYWLARIIVGSMDLFGKGTSLPPLQKDFQEDEKNNVTTSKIRRNYVFKQRIKEQSALIGPATASWASQALIVTRVIAKKADHLSAPALVIEAGKDEYVNSAGIEKVCQKAKACKKIVFEGGMHELYLENDAIRRDLLRAVDQFYGQL